jgi:hypothetical protein
VTVDELHPDDRDRIARRRRSRARRLADAEETFRRWLYLPDVGALHVALGNIAANRIEGDPTWLLIVGAPSSGKTEIIGAFARLDYTHSTATLTEAGLLSGSPKREKATDGTGGLLHTMGAFGILLTKDFGSVLSMHRDEQARVLAALREVYDGSWTRLLGVDGGRTLSWRGKCGFLGGCTPTIDRAHAVMGALGERFMLYRLALDDPTEQGNRRVANRGHEHQMRDDLDHAVADVLDGITSSTKAAELSEAEKEWLVRSAVFAVTARTAVERDGYHREVELLPEREGPARLVGQLAQMSAGLSAVGLTDETRWRLLAKLAGDCIPSLRRAVLVVLADAGRDWLTRAVVSDRTLIPYTTVGRTLEDLNLVGLVAKVGNEARYSLSEMARDAWPQASPEM